MLDVQKTPTRKRRPERGFHNYLGGDSGGGGDDGHGGGGGRRRRGPNIHTTQPPPGTVVAINFACYVQVDVPLRLIPSTGGQCAMVTRVAQIIRSIVFLSISGCGTL